MNAAKCKGFTLGFSQAPGNAGGCVPGWPRFSAFPGLMVLAALFLAGCAQTAPYHENSVANPRASIVPGPDYKLAFVEFGEQGSYQDTSQLDNALDLIKRTPRPVVVTYVHGWHNNADSADARDKFPTMLQELGQSAAIRAAHFQVIGVFLGWRGEFVTAPVLRQLTFYNRKAAAERLASNYDCFDAIAAISEAAHKYHPVGSQYSILVGHSFGGLVVERSVAHAINAEMHGHADSEKSLPADLILLLNPAADSILARQMISALYARHIPDNRQLVVSLTSTADDATGMWFPAGTNLAATTKVFDKIRVPSPERAPHLESERTFFTSTPGHNPFLLNHRTVRRPETVANPEGKSAFDFNLEHNHFGHGFVTDSPTKPGRLQVWKFEDLPGPFGYVDVPYWDVAVDPAIIKDHGDIWNPEARAMMAAIFRMNFPHAITAGASKPSILPHEARSAASASAPEKPNLHREPAQERLQYRQSQ